MATGEAMATRGTLTTGEPTGTGELIFTGEVMPTGEVEVQSVQTTLDGWIVTWLLLLAIYSMSTLS